ncbi:hypothetical protein [Candidatus Villigracilis saccharophilus]|uniref:hypothetical protein n=1 Tax=Candidatus Villigracilis saccharophilus TaxID=3140684 RepID=UPI003135DE82|nr:hypothetical protein [Anaerolineales bacterium]
MSRRKNRNINTRSGLSALLRRPSMQLAMLAFVAFIICHLFDRQAGAARPQHFQPK